MPPVSKLIRLIVGFVCMVLAASAMLGVIACLLNSPKPAWFTLAFEVVTLCAGLTGIGVAVGRFKEGPAVTIGCIAASTLIGSALGYVGAGGLLGSIGLRPFLGARCVLGAVLAGLAATIVLARTWPLCARPLYASSVFLVLLGGGAAAAWIGRSWFSGQTELVQFLCAIVGFLVGTGLLSAGVQRAADAFTIGQPVSTVGLRTDAAAN